jgi:hypothetical protein
MDGRVGRDRRKRWRERQVRMKRKGGRDRNGDREGRKEKEREMEEEILKGSGGTEK